VILVTGFEAFGPHTVNSSQVCAEELSGLSIAGQRVIGVTLPVAYRPLPKLLSDLLREHKPALIICLGLSGKASGLVLESRARREHGGALDNEGFGPEGEAAFSHPGPAELGTTLDLPGLALGLEGRGIPARISDDAGRYLCEFCFYEGLGLSAALGLGPLQFVHLPPLSEDWTSGVLQEAVTLFIELILESRSS